MGYLITEPIYYARVQSRDYYDDIVGGAENAGRDSKAGLQNAGQRDGTSSA